MENAVLDESPCGLRVSKDPIPPVAVVITSPFSEIYDEKLDGRDQRILF